MHAPTFIPTHTNVTKHYGNGLRDVLARIKYHQLDPGPADGMPPLILGPQALATEDQLVSAVLSPFLSCMLLATHLKLNSCSPVEKKKKTF